ncbi:MAG TPA: uL22 family ribosomal protein [Candidatus Saccharimonadales bacterium]|jgi:large subunit ribosomal protein L22|nr:uL22 family ribosomal protein [Candidatus Saccharimonadales bacterium]
MKKEFKATQKYLLMSPRKIRLVVAVIKKMKPAEAVDKLPFVQKRAGAELAKVIKSAITSAKNAGVSETDLIFKEIQIGEGPRLKRGKAASRGMWHPFKRRMSHIRVILTTIKSQEPSTKPQTNSKEEKPKTDVKTEKIENKKDEKKKGETKSK